MSLCVCPIYSLTHASFAGQQGTERTPILKGPLTPFHLSLLGSRQLWLWPSTKGKEMRSVVQIFQVKASVLSNLDSAKQKDLGLMSMRHTFQDKFCLFVHVQFSPHYSLLLLYVLNKLIFEKTPNHLLGAKRYGIFSFLGHVASAEEKRHLLQDQGVRAGQVLPQTNSSSLGSSFPTPLRQVLFSIETEFTQYTTYIKMCTSHKVVSCNHHWLLVD